MYKRQSLVKNVINGINNAVTTSCRFFSQDKSLKFDKVLVVSKLSRYQYEKAKNRQLSEKELTEKLCCKGVDVHNLMYHHELHKEFESRFIDTLNKLGCDVRIANRFNFSEESVSWADVVVPIGGDGTFLLGASKVLDNQKPVVGFNSDPRRSEGHLCLPKHYSSDITGAVARLRQGKFDWLYRSRIRTKLLKHSGKIVCKSVHDSGHSTETVIECSNKSAPQIIPVLALNEVFVGESYAPRVSNLKLRLDGSSAQTYVKCSGVCVATGTGSTSWHMSINRIAPQDVAELLRLLDYDPKGGKYCLSNLLSEWYNKGLKFNADDPKMAYTIRDMIDSEVWPTPKGILRRGFANNLEIVSNTYDACLVVDGGLSFDFEDGAIAMFEIQPEDALKTVLFKDED